MNRRELRLFLDGRFCGCGSPSAALGALLRLLELHPLYDNRKPFEEWVPDEGLQYLLLYMLDRDQLTEHGSSVGGAWLTDEGEKLRDGLRREKADDFEALLADHCVHGFDITDESHNCLEAE